jgi:lysophospholipase L1-like esterase
MNSIFGMRKIIYVFTLWVLLATGCLHAELPQEFRARGGLPHFHAKIEAGEAVRIAFLGGSITAANGWRPGILEELRQAHPDVRFDEVNAAISGTGSDYGAARLRDEVLMAQPDLLFIEFAVNDQARDPGSIRRSMEGIVRQARKALPEIDIFFVYTLNLRAAADMESGRYTATVEAMEEIAEHYALSSLHFGVEVMRRVHSGSVTLDSKPPGPGIEVFATDGTHPTSAGHRIYVEVLASAMKQLSARPGKPAARVLPDPLEPQNWEGASLIPIGERTGVEWRLLPQDDSRLSSIQSGRRRATWVAEEPGTVLEFSFTGTVFGIAGIKGPDAGLFRVQVEGREAITTTLFDRYCRAGRYRIRRWMYPEELPPGTHKVTIELLQEAPNKASILGEAPEYVTVDPAYAENVLILSDLIVVELVGDPLRREPIE